MKKIRLKFANGLSFADGVRDILFPLRDEFEFMESDCPEFVIFGPYGNDVPPPGGPVRIGYFCENMYPDMSICDWAFGMLHEEDVGHPRYMRILWHGLAPEDLRKPPLGDPDRFLQAKTRFCNFVYSNPVPYRERFFRELTKYRHIDAPGFSMNNMAGIDTDPGGDRWETKRRFLQQYKFTIAFENYSYPGYGYNVEKIQDAMRALTLPIYFGNPRVDEPFNQRSFINGHDYVRGRFPLLTRALEYCSQPKFRGAPTRANLPGRLLRRAQRDGRTAKMRLQCWDFGPLIDEIVRIDRDDELYLSYMAQPWFVGNAPPSNERARLRWRRIFSGEGGGQ